MSPDERARSLGIDLGAPFPPVGSYVNAVRVGDQLVLGGHVPFDPPDRIVLGRLGDDLDVEQGRAAAELAAINAVKSIHEALGSLDAVQQLIVVRGVVNATPEFTEHTRVIDAASDVLVAVFGDRGRHARLAVGVSSLPARMALEIELVLQVARVERSTGGA